MRSVQSTFEMYVKLNKKIQPEVLDQRADHRRPRAPLRHHRREPADRQARRPPSAARDARRAKQRLERLIELMQAEVEILQVEKKIRSRVKKQMEKTQKEYYLNEQMQAIQKELGGGERDEFKNEIQEIERHAQDQADEQRGLAKVKKELKKLKMMHPTSAEATVVRNYIDWILELPWDEKSEERYDLGPPSDPRRGPLRPEEDQGAHPRVPRRAGAHQEAEGPVLCFVGPPGVGKTSLAKSIARATGRKFVRLSLGGVRDEAEIRGHRRTYIGALPARSFRSLKKAGTNNPVFLLDEVDKMSTDFRGDPAAALLEVLDPEQNHTLQRSLPRSGLRPQRRDVHHDGQHAGGIPVPLQDRMEIIQLSGYTEFEKLNIAVRSTSSRASRRSAAWRRCPSTFTDGGLRTVIHHYTKESGVRSLEREIASVCRKVARKVVAEGKDQPIEIDGQERARSCSGCPSIASAGARRRTRLASSRAGRHLRRRRSAARRGHGHPRQGQAGGHRPAREGHGGERPGRDELRALPPRAARPRQGRTSIKRSTCTCTSPTSCARTGRAPASPW
jgi:ATP-dependent Lon protease